MPLGKAKEVFEYTDEAIFAIENEIQREVAPALNLEKHEEHENELILKFSYTYDNIVKKIDQLELKYITLRDILDVYVDIIEVDGVKKLRIQYPERDLVITNFLKKRNAHIRTMEEILAEEGAPKFIKVPEIRENLNPIREVFNLLELEGSFKKKDWDTWNLKRERAKLYLNLLNDYEYIQFEGDNICKGEKWKIIDDREFDDVEDVEVERILSKFFKETYNILSTKRYNLTLIKPYLNIGNACYYTSVIDDEIYKQDSKSIKDIHDSLFTETKTLSKIKTYLMELATYGIVERKGSYFLPSKDIFAGFRSNQKRLSFFTP